MNGSRRDSRQGRTLTAGFIALGTVLALTWVAAPAFAAEQAGAYKYTSSTNFDAWRGSHDIRTGPGTVNGVGYVHAMQMDVGASGGNFVAIGTAKGLGVSGTNCADRYSGKWNIYTDGEAFGTYFCNDEVLNAHEAGDNVPFTINYGDCPGDAGNRWRLYMGGNFHQCVNQGSSTASRAMVMLETTGSSNVDRNIDVKYTGLQYLITGVWVNLENATDVVAPSYTVTAPANAKINAFLAPLD